MDIKNAALFGGFGALGMLWGQIRQFFSRIYSIGVVNVEIQGMSTDAVMAYLWTHFKVSRLGDRRFTGLESFIKPKDRRGVVAYEQVGKSLTFFKDWKPIFVSTIQSKSTGETTGGITISFIRGTFDLDKLIAIACAELDEYNHCQENESGRYYVRKCLGRRNRSGPEVAEPVGGKSHEDYGSRRYLRIIGYDQIEIGVPSSNVPFKNLSYDPHVNEFKTEINRWKNSEKWYKEKGLNWRFGAGIFGLPGTGKSSFVRAIGQEMDMPIHAYDLTTMDNEELCNFWRESLSCAPCIVLFEDIDRIFDKDKNIKTTQEKSVTLDCLLNCIGGVEPANGILVIVTANDITKLDPALGTPDVNGKSSRPGRLDRAVYFGPLSATNRLEIANRLLSDCSHHIERVVKEGEGETGAQFENRCATLAIKEYWGDVKFFKSDFEDISKEEQNAQTN